MSKAFTSSGKVHGKGKDNTKSSGNIELNITDIVVSSMNNNNNSNEIEGGKVRKSKREKITVTSMKPVENKSEDIPVVEACVVHEPEIKVDTNKKIDNSLAVALKPTTIPYIETPWSIIGA